MRGLRSTALLIIVLAALVGYLYYLDRDGAPDPNAREKVFAEVATDDIEEVQIATANGTPARVQKTDGAWRLLEPVQAAADSTEMSSIVNSLASIDIQRVVDENAANVSQYGLEPAHVTVSFRAKGETEPRRLLLGEKTPAGSDVYAMRPGSRRVFLVSSFLETTVNKEAFALRDRRVLTFDRDKADGLELASGATVVQLAKNGTDWRLLKPIAARADFGQVESIVVRLGSANMESVVDETGSTGTAKYGLDRPTATFTVSAGGERTTLTLGATDNALVFAKDSSRPMVFTVAPTLKDDVLKAVSDYRRKDLFDARSFTATRIELVRGAEMMAFEKSKDGDNEVWKTAAGETADATKIEDLLTKVTSLRADAFEAGSHAALKAPILTATVRFDQDRTETVTFGRAGTDVFATRSDEPGTARLAAAGFDEALKAIDAMK